MSFKRSPDPLGRFQDNRIDIESGRRPQPEQHVYRRRGAEEGAVRGYNETIRLAEEVGDNNNNEVLVESILKDEEDHIDWIGAQVDQVKQMEVQSYLVRQMH